MDEDSDYSYRRDHQRAQNSVNRGRNSLIYNTSPESTTSPTLSDNSVITNEDGSKTTGTHNHTSTSPRVIMNENNNGGSRPASRYSVSNLSEVEKAQWLRDEISRESMSLKRLERLAQDLPKLSGNNHRSSTLMRDELPDDGHLVNDAHSTSRVIENLQNGMDALKRELKEQREIAKEERSNREAVKKRCEILESTMEVVKHQNEMLNRLLDRKERRIDGMESSIRKRDDKISKLEKAQVESSDHRNNFETKLDEQNEEKARLEAAYNAVLDSSKKMKQKHHNDIVAIGEKITEIQNDKKLDAEKLVLLEKQLQQQTAEKENLLTIQTQQTKLREGQIQKLDSVFTDIKNSISESDDTVTQKVKSTLKVIDKLERYYIELGGDQRNVEGLRDEVEESICG